MRIFISILIMIALPFFILKKGKADSTATKYCNSRYQFCVEYPSDIFPNKIISDNNDGIKLTSKEGELSATFFGSWNVTNKSPQQLYQTYAGKRVSKDADSELVFKEVSKEDFEASFIEDGFIIYQRLFHSDDKFLLFQIKSPEHKSDRIDNVMKDIRITFDE